MSRSLRFALLAALSGVCCTGTDVGNPVADLDFPLYNPNFDSAASTVEISEAWIAVDRVRLRDAADCDGNSELEIAGPFAIDLLDIAAIPELSGLELRPIDYCRFELRWDSVDNPLPAPVPPELTNASIVVIGTRAGTSFVVRSDRNDELRLDALGGSFTVSDATNALFVGFDGERLFSGVDFDSAIVDGDGVIRIEDGSNDTQLSVFENNLDLATQLFDDDDGDGQLDPDERDSTDVLAD